MQNEIDRRRDWVIFCSKFYTIGRAIDSTIYRYFCIFASSIQSVSKEFECGCSIHDTIRSHIRNEILICLYQQDGVHVFLFPVSLLLLLPCKTKVHASITDHPNHDDSSSNHSGIVWGMETLMSVQMLKFPSQKKLNHQAEIQRIEIELVNRQDERALKRSDGSYAEKNDEGALTSSAGRLLTNFAHSSFALCSLGAVDMRRDKERLAT